MRIIPFLQIVFLGALGSIQLAAQQPDSIRICGEWVNELGSMLVIDSISLEDGRIHGRYQSSTGVDGQVFPLMGWYNKHSESATIAVGFSVHWASYGSITSWTGYLQEDEIGRSIKTLWHLVRPQKEPPWERITSNSSTFREVLKMTE